MAPLSVVYPNEDAKKKNERPQTAINGGGDVVQRSPQKTRPSSVTKIIPPNHRDKESLLDELLELKNAVLEQQYHVERHLQYKKQVQEENKQLEKSVENLELAYGLEAPRVGGEGKLMGKLLGLKACLHEKQLQVINGKAEISILQKDIRITHSRELEIERDLFAAEVRTLQKSVRGLRRIFIRVNSENEEIQRLRQKIKKLENRNKELEGSIEMAKKRTVDATSEIDAANKQISQDNAAASRANSKFLELASHSIVLQKLKREQESEKMKLEHQILRVGDDTRRVLKEKINANKSNYDDNYADDEPYFPWDSPFKSLPKIKLPEQPQNPNENKMILLEADFLAQIKTAITEFTESVPASQLQSPRDEAQIEADHTTFETRRDFFTNKVEEAQVAFLIAMEEIEYGAARTKPGESPAAKKLSEEVAQLNSEIARLKGMGSGGKRWRKEKVTVASGDEKVKGDLYRVSVADRGAEIEIDIDVTKVVQDARGKILAEAKRMNEAAKKAVQERDKLAAELKGVKEMGAGGKRWKTENVSIVVGNTKLSTEEYDFEVQDQGAGIDVGVIVHRMSRIVDEVEAAKQKLLGDKKKAPKQNVKEALQHLENIGKVVSPKASRASPSGSK